MRGSAARVGELVTFERRSTMYRAWMTVGLILLTLPGCATAPDAIASARSAGPDSISADATVMDWDLNVVR